MLKKEKKKPRSVPCAVVHMCTMFDMAIEHQPKATTVYNTSVLRELHTLAAIKENAFHRTKLDKYFIFRKNKTSCY